MRAPSRPSAVAVSLVLALRRRLRGAADRLVPPQLRLLELAAGAAYTHALSAVADLGIPDRLQRGPATAEALAEELGVDADALARLMRACAAAGIFRVDRQGRYDNRRLARAMTTDAPASFRHMALYLGSDSNIAAWRDLQRSLATGTSAFERVHGMSVWQWFDEHPDERETFAAAMTSVTELQAPALARCWRFGELDRICDVGGGRGGLLSAILTRHRRPRGVLLDASGVVELARAHLGRSGLLDRVELVAGSFFDAVPEGCDAYLLKNVLHDWDDASCGRILDNVRRAASRDARLLVVESDIDVPDDLGPLMDLQMMVVTVNGRERNAAQYAELLGRSGFRMERVVPVLGPLRLFEAVAV